MADSNIYTNLPNRRKFPMLGLGTWQSRPDTVRQAVEAAIAFGYRHIDTAFCYENEKEIGQAIKSKVDDGTIQREDLFVTTKLWMSHSHPDDVETNCRQSLNNLGLDYVDLYLMHQPMALARNKGGFPLDDAGFLLDNEGDFDYVDTWRAMESLLDEGLVRAIGVSNVNISQIQRILDLPPKHPVANVQNECHPLLAESKLVDFCKDHGITFTAYSPLGSPQRPPTPGPDQPMILENPVVCEIAERCRVTPAQVLIRFQLHRGLVVIPKSVTPSRIQQNFKALTFELSDDDFKRLLGLDKHRRLLPFPMAIKMKHYAFTDDE